MSAESWEKVDRYLEAALGQPDDVLAEVLRTSAGSGLPPIQVSTMQGAFLQVLARLVGARLILEVGSLGGYSAIWMARALPPGGRLVSLEVDPRHAEVARSNIARAGLSGIAEVRLGAALQSLPAVADEFGRGVFDLVFIDADKPSNPAYFEWAVQLARPGGAIVVDNVVRQGQVADAESDDPNVVGTRQLFESIARGGWGGDAAALQTVGSKGHDGFAIVVAPGPPS